MSINYSHGRDHPFLDITRKIKNRKPGCADSVKFLCSGMNLKILVLSCLYIVYFQTGVRLINQTFNPDRPYELRNLIKKMLDMEFPLHYKTPKLNCIDAGIEDTTLCIKPKSFEVDFVLLLDMACALIMATTSLAIYGIHQGQRYYMVPNIILNYIILMFSIAVTLVLIASKTSLFVNVYFWLPYTVYMVWFSWMLQKYFKQLGMSRRRRRFE